MPTGEKAQELRKVIQDWSEENIDAHIAVRSWSPELEQAVNEHIHLEKSTWYAFSRLASDAGRADVSLHGFSMLFARCAFECLMDACFLERYLVQRGGRVRPKDIPAPEGEFSSAPIEPHQPVYYALNLEKAILEDCLRLCSLADKHKDAALEDVIESRFLHKETQHVKDLGDLLKEVNRVSKTPGHGLYHLDKDLRNRKGKAPWGPFNQPEAFDALFESMAEMHFNESST